MKRKFWKWYYSIFKTYRRLELKCLTYGEADKLLKQNEGKSESNQWRLAKEEDTNSQIGIVFLERRERITT